MGSDEGASQLQGIGSAPRPPVEDENLDGRPVDNFCIDLEVTLTIRRMAPATRSSPRDTSCVARITRFNEHSRYVMSAKVKPQNVICLGC